MPPEVPPKTPVGGPTSVKFAKTGTVYGCEAPRLSLPASQFSAQQPSFSMPWRSVAKLPAHLRMTFRITGEDGNPLAEGKDLPALREQLRDLSDRDNPLRAFVDSTIFRDAVAHALLERGILVGSADITSQVYVAE